MPHNCSYYCFNVGGSISLFIIILTIAVVIVVLCIVITCHHRSKNLSEDNYVTDIPNTSSLVTGPIYAEITDEELKDPTYASVGKATGKYTYNITTNTSYDTVILHSMNPNACYGTAVLHDIDNNTGT